MFESQISLLELLKRYFVSEKLGANISSWSYDIEGHAKKCVGRYCELLNRTTQQLYKVATPCIDDHQLKKKWDLLENCQKFALKLSPSGPEVATNVQHV